MGETYLKLDPKDLNRIFQTNQPSQININKASENGRIEEISGKATIIAFDENSMTLSLSKELLDWIDLFLPEKMITIQSGYSNELILFRSKIRKRFIQDSLQIIIESPRMIVKRERRISRRKPLFTSVNYRILRLGDRDLKHLTAKIGTGESQDLSKGGITLLTDLQLPVGLTLLIEFPLADKKITLIGQIRHTYLLRNSHYSFAIGIQFIQTSPEEQRLISQSIQNEETLKGDISF